MADELTDVDEWMVTQLRASTTLSAALASSGFDSTKDAVYVEEIAENATMPYVLIKTVNTEDLMVVGASRIMTKPVYDVMAVSETESYKALDTIMSEIDTQLHGKSGTQDSTTISFCRREGGTRFPEVRNSRHFRWRVFTYRIWTT